MDFNILGILVRKTSVHYNSDGNDNETIARREIATSVQEGLVVEKDNGVAFVHDAVQGAAYSLLQADEIPSFHLSLGRILQKNLNSALLQRYLFTVANQLARGRNLIPEAERINAIHIFLRAGDEESKMAAFVEATFFYEKGLSMLLDQDWRNHYRLSCEIHMRTAEIAVLNGAYDDVDRLLDVLFLNTKGSVDDQLRATYIKVKKFASLEKAGEGFDCSIQALDSLAGVKIPTRNVTMHSLVSSCCKVVY